MVENEILIKQLKVLIDYGKVNEFQSIVDVAENAITAIERLTRERDAAVRAMETMVRESIPCDFCLPENRSCHGEPLDDDGCHCDRFVWRGVRE